MQGIQQICFSNSKTFAANPGALKARAIEVYHKLNADELEHLDKFGTLPARIVDAITAQGFDDYALTATVRSIHETF